jgi:hypothetical protein
MVDMAAEEEGAKVWQLAAADVGIGLGWRV